MKAASHCRKRASPPDVNFDFSGYSNMAIGIARMFGVRLPVNFNSPYKACSIIDFWHRWHITLSRFLRDCLYIQPGKPTQNAYVERFNQTVRHEWLDLHSFNSIEHAQLLATQWLWTCNNERPHTAIGGVPPGKLLEAA
jgi:D-alanyl-lipoteichoic acid acyltransferase DltB (MBOAT superfamily)